ncbi:MAG TPA: FtsX-like permease family protein [Rubricoccaceae bacterium]
MDYRLLIARRYLVGRRRLTLISVITGVSVAGVAVGVAALVVVLSVMNGFFDVVRDLLVSYDPHVRIEASGGGGLSRPDTLAALARLDDGVVSATPFVEGQALLTTEGAGTLNQVVTVRGVDPGALDATVGAAIRDGAFDLTRRGSEAGIVVGGALATRTGTFAASPPGSPARVAGSRVTLLSGVALEQALALYPFGLPDQRAFTVRGTYELEPTYDQTHVFVALADAQQIFRLGGTVSGVDVRLADLDRAPAVAEALRERLDAAAPGRFTVQTWADLQGSLYGVMRAEKWAASAILLLIVVVAAFTIVGALTMIVIEKQRDLGALQAMGASRADVQRIFLLEGFLVGGIGTGIGLVLGLGLAFAQKAFGFAKLADPGQFVIDAYPVSVRPFDVALIAVVAVGLCAVAALYPASRAARVDPARAVQGA